jgi:hypothetical protein
MIAIFAADDDKNSISWAGNSVSKSNEGMESIVS